MTSNEKEIRRYINIPPSLDKSGNPCEGSIVMTQSRGRFFTSTSPLLYRAGRWEYPERPENSHLLQGIITHWAPMDDLPEDCPKTFYHLSLKEDE